MEEVQVIDCPPTPEILLPSSTPPSSSLLDMLDSSSSAEEVDVGYPTRAEEGTAESGRSSPPPKCAICLGKCRQKCYTDSCRHQFCYRCLLEWSKIKAECPLCKQVFRSIIYKQKMFDRYEEQIIGIVPPGSPMLVPSRDGSVGGSGAVRAPQVYHRLDFTLSQSPRFTYSATLRVQPSQSERLQQLFLHQSGDVQRFSREFADDSIPSRQNGPEWRRYIYHRRLHARPLPDINGRLRECSAAFYRENPAQIHRLMPWINRELIALCRGNPSQITLIMEDFPNLLMTHDITSTTFRERVSYWGRSRTVHFIHELLNFARSPYDMIGYDRSVQYDPYYNSVVVLSSSSSSSGSSTSSVSEGSDGEDDVVRIVEPVPGTSRTVESTGGPSGSSRRGRTQFTIETRSSDQTVIMTGSFGGAGVSGIVSVSTSGTQTNGNVGGGSSSSGFPDVSRMHPLTSLPAPVPVSRLDDGANISLSSSDSDDCRIVGALKPPHLRTPEMVSLESESDSDVVFVNDDVNRREEPVPLVIVPVDQQGLDANYKQENSGKLEECSGASAAEYNNGASTSGSSVAVGTGAGSGLKKYYAKPRLNRPSNGQGIKSIYEASESSEKSENSCTQADSDSSSHAEEKHNSRSKAAAAGRRRKATKRRPATSAETSDESSDQSSTSDVEISPNSSSSFPITSSSWSSDSGSESDFKVRRTTRVAVKNRTSKTKLRQLRSSSSKRRQSKLKKRSKVKKQKSLPSRTSRKRSKTASKSANSSIEQRTASVPLPESLPSGSNTSPKLSLNDSPRKRKLRSAVIKPETSVQPTPKKRRKVPICSELISSTDFSAEEEPPVVSASVAISEPLPTPPEEAAEKPPGSPPSFSEVSSEDDGSDSEERCTIASLINAAKRQSAESDKKSDRQNTSTASTGSSSSGSSSSSSSSSSAGSNNSASTNASTGTFGSNECTVDTSVSSTRTDNQRSSQASDEEASVSQTIAVGAEVEL
ncbi:E3 ubiquitin-protein ligase Topors-like [Sabethes cyaneus]|uniref:E3 ubiquitin-protein ligase Topors-like n=1 Tax=Sabethes cyaneus TaxID=53552 RepID=UPI00237E3DB3|nr:E3 ubiquitin-protein ligase Topors-like [Sabethes cyaneus]